MTASDDLEGSVTSKHLEACLKNATRVVSRLATHDEGYDDALRTGTVPKDVCALVAACFEHLSFAIGEIAGEISSHGGLPVKPERYRLLSSRATCAGSSPGESILADLRAVAPALAHELSQILDVSNADGWLRRLSGITESPETLDLRRAIGFASLTQAANGTRELSLKSASGEAIPMVAPILMDESVTTAGTGQAYYLAILPDAVEVTSFMDRCTRGVDQLSAQVREALNRLDR